jgi:anti-sigma-K factor RskA
MRDPAEILAAYVDGVAELTPEERRAVEARIAGDPKLRADEAVTRKLIGELRDLGPAADNEPDWAAMERAIGEAVGPTVPRPWWRARVWRWLAPALGTVAATAAILLLVTRTDPTPHVPTPTHHETNPPVATQTTPSEESVSLWLDGENVEVSMSAEDLLGPEDLDDDDIVTNGLLPTTDLAWIDGLDDESLDLAEHVLAPRKKG